MAIFNRTDNFNNIFGIPSQYLWVPYVSFGVVLILFFVASFLRFHFKLKNRRRKSMSNRKLRRQTRAVVRSNMNKRTRRSGRTYHGQRSNPRIHTTDYSNNRNTKNYTSLMAASVATKKWTRRTVQT